jgi:Plavaka transposase
MFVPVVAGSDKTTVSVATGHQEYHPVYMSPGNLTNTARRAHGNSVLPVAFLPIPKSMASFHDSTFLRTDIYSIKETQEDGKVPDFLPTNVSCLLGACFRSLEGWDVNTRGG